MIKLEVCLFKHLEIRNNGSEKTFETFDKMLHLLIPNKKQVQVNYFHSSHRCYCPLNVNRILCNLAQVVCIYSPQIASNWTVINL